MCLCLCAVMGQSHLEMQYSTHNSSKVHSESGHPSLWWCHPAAHCTLHTEETSQSQTTTLRAFGFTQAHQNNYNTLKQCMWKNSPSVSMIMAAPFSSGWEQPEQSRFPLTHLHTTRRYTKKKNLQHHNILLWSVTSIIKNCHLFVLASSPAGGRRLRWWKGWLLFVWDGIMWFGSVVPKNK